MVFYGSQANTLINKQDKKVCSGKKEKEREGGRKNGWKEAKVLFSIVFKDGLEHRIRGVSVCLCVRVCREDILFCSEVCSWICKHVY